jgi:hypothetical protein
LNFEFVCLCAQLRHSYNGGCERNDHSLFHYGFVQDLAAPKLAAQDLPDGNLYDESSHSEADYGVCLMVYISTHLLRVFCISGNYAPNLAPAGGGRCKH